MKNFFLLLFFIFLISFTFVNAVPELPMIVSGDVYINEKKASIGTEITAIADGEEVVNFKIATKGKFSFLIQKLEGDKLIKFYVDGIDTGVSVNYKTGDFQNLNLAVKKPYLGYYIVGGLIALGAIFLIWKLKTK